MLCPKCGQNYPDSGQRFCDNDGTRLVPDDLSARLSSGVFKRILPTQPIENERPDLESALLQERSADTRSVAEIRRDAKMEELFEEQATGDRSTRTMISSSAARPVIGRRVLPGEIPAGHVDLYDRHQVPQHLNDFQPESPASFVGKTVKGRYRVTDMIGEDNSGYAYFAEDVLGDGRRVVVRILAGFDDEDDVTRSIYAEERVALSHLNHPNVAKILDSGSYSDGTEYVISDHLDGLSVADLIAIHGRFEAGRAARIIKQAAYAITDVQREGVLHRDIRGANITVVPLDGTSELVTVSNFGVAGARPNEDNFRYQAPEVLRGRIPNVASDTFSLAVTAYEMLTGQLPFAGDSPSDIVAKQKNARFDKITSIRKDVPATVNDVFAKAFAIDPRERFLSSRDLGDALTLAVTQPLSAAHAVNSMPVKPIEASTQRSTGIISERITVPSQPPTEETRGSIPREPNLGPAWQRRSPEPPVEQGSGWLKIAVACVGCLIILAGLSWYFLIGRQPAPEPVNSAGPSVTVPEGTITAAEVVRPPNPRHIPQPENTSYYENLKQNLSGDLIRNFVGFKMYIPNSWRSSGATPSSTSNGRGKFIDIARSTDDGKLMEQMLISYYPSKGSLAEDTPAFPQLVKETNETLKKLIPGYQMLSAGEIKINGDWQAYEVKFQGSGTTGSGERLLVWGRRIFMPAARQGVRNGFEITMLATSYAPDVRSVDDVGVKGELANILYTFEPSQSF